MLYLIRYTTTYFLFVNFFPTLYENHFIRCYFFTSSVDNSSLKKYVYS